MSAAAETLHMPVTLHSSTPVPTHPTPSAPAASGPSGAPAAAPAPVDGFERVSSAPAAATPPPAIPGDAGTAVGAIDRFNDPQALAPNANFKLADLPLSGRAAREPWTGSYWPKMHGGIANRWRTGEKQVYESPRLDELKAMSADEIEKLSPAEKYDIFCGCYSFPLTAAAKGANPANTPAWHGYCHGWAQAAIHFPEPEPITVTNEHGITIPFGSSDLKALLTFFQGEVVRSQFSSMQHPFKAETRSIGSNYQSRTPLAYDAFDLNPGSFHVLLGNLIGERKTAFAIDCDNSAQKWNQPVHAYQSEILTTRAPSEGAAPNAVEERVVKTDVTYRLEINPQHDPAGAGVANRTDTYHYTLELDASGRVVGGQWLAPTTDGDFMRYHDVYAHLTEQEGMTKQEAAQKLLSIFRLPDYAYVQEKGEFADQFVPASSSWTFVSGDKTKLWPYFAKLAALLPE